MITRRGFGQLLGVGAVAAALPPLVATTRAATAAAAETTVRLSANENPYGPSSAAVAAIKDSFGLIPRYPDDAMDLLMDDLAKFHGVAPGQITLGDGSSEILKLAASAAFADGARKVVMADPTFEALAHYAKAMKADVVKVPLDAAHAHDLGRMLDAAKDGGLVYICNPNNPTATITPKAAIRSFIEAAPASALILVDEAYHHYATSPDYDTMIPLVRQHANLVVARTFSKIYGMAGLRCGYAVAQPETIQRMQAHGAWDNVNIMALTAARASLPDRKHVEDGRRRNSETKAWLAAELQKMGYRMLPSEANFVMIELKRDVKPLIGAMKARNVEVGRLFPAMPQHMRLTIGTPEQMKRFVGAFAEVVA